MLTSELALVPSPALRELERRMLRQDPTLPEAAPRRSPRAAEAIARDGVIVAAPKSACCPRHDVGPATGGAHAQHAQLV